MPLIGLFITVILLLKKVQNGEINKVDGNKLGIQKKNGDLVNINELVGTEYIEFDKDSYGIYIPWNELILRTKLQWFVRLSPTQVLESDTIIGKYLVANN